MWGLVGAFGPIFRQTFHLSNTQAALLVVVPVLLGSVARIPAGMLTDRFGGRVVFTSLMILVAAAAAITPSTNSYEGLLAGPSSWVWPGRRLLSASDTWLDGRLPDTREARSVFMVSERSVNLPPYFLGPSQQMSLVGRMCSMFVC